MLPKELDKFSGPRESQGDEDEWTEGLEVIFLVAPTYTSFGTKDPLREMELAIPSTDAHSLTVAWKMVPKRQLSLACLQISNLIRLISDLKSRH